MKRFQHAGYGEVLQSSGALGHPIYFWGQLRSEVYSNTLDKLEDLRERKVTVRRFEDNLF